LLGLDEKTGRRVSSEEFGGCYQGVRARKTVDRQGGWPPIPSNFKSQIKLGAPFFPRSLRKGWEARMQTERPKTFQTYRKIASGTVLNSQIGTGSAASPLFSCSHPPLSIRYQYIGYL
jgi:hypothetical protein